MTFAGRRLLPPSALFLLLGAALTIRVLYRPTSHTVFPVFAAGGVHWWNDEPLYADHAPLDYFRYPPVFALAFSPFSWLGPEAGGILWAWVSLGVHWLGLRRLLGDVLPGQWNERRELVFLFLALVGALPGLWNGQSNALLAGLLMLGLSSAVRGRWWRGGVFLALTAVLKLTPLPLCLLLGVVWPRTLLPRLLACISVGLMLPFLTRPPDVVVHHYREWIAHLNETSSRRWPGFRDGWTALIVMRHLSADEVGLPDLEQPLEGAWYRGLQALAGLAVLAWGLWLRRCGLEEKELATLTLAGGAAWLMLLGPASEHPTFAFLAPFLAWGIVQGREGRWGCRLIEASALCVFVLGWGTLTRPLWGVAPWLILALPAGTALFLAWLIVRGAQARWGRSGEPSRTDSATDPDHRAGLSAVLLGSRHLPPSRTGSATDLDCRSSVGAAVPLGSRHLPSLKPIGSIYSPPPEIA